MHHKQRSHLTDRIWAHIKTRLSEADGEAACVRWLYLVDEQRGYKLSPLSRWISDSARSHSLALPVGSGT